MDTLTTEAPEPVGAVTHEPINILINSPTITPEARQS